MKNDGVGDEERLTRNNGNKGKNDPLSKGEDES